MTSVPLLDLTRQYELFKASVEEKVIEICRSQRFILGPEVEAMEAEMCAAIGAKYSIGVSSGTDALLMAMMALDIGPGDEVITTPYTFFATVSTIARLGAKAVLVDIEPDGFNLRVDQIEEKITSRTKAIIPVHLFGQCAEMDTLIEIAKRRGIPVIEDAAQAIGATWRGKQAGTIGEMGCFSFFPSKNLGAFGDAGLVTTNDSALANKLKMLRMHGEERRYHHAFLGGNFRIDALQAGVLRIKLPFLAQFASGRRANAQRYFKLFKQSGLVGSDRSPLVLPPELPNCHHVYNQFVIRAPGTRDDLLDYLTKAGVGCAIYYPRPLHLQECFSNLGHKIGDFPQSELAAEETLAIPVYSELSSEELERVVAVIAEFFSASAHR